MDTHTTELVPANGTKAPIAAVGETAVAASAAQARATVEARYIVAMRQPRSLDVVRERLLADCRRPRFAEVAKWKRPVGGKMLFGPSIRLAEAAIRAMGNIDQETQAVFDDAEKRIVRVSVTDLEANTTFSVDITVAKTVERRDGEGRDVLGARPNKDGQMVYIVRATDDELMAKQAALVSKAIRTCALRLVPGDILEEAQELAAATLANQDKQDPEAARKRLLDSFAAIGVTASMIGKHLGHDTKALSEAERFDLRSIYAAIRDGEARWTDFAAESDGEDGGKGAGSNSRIVKARQAAAAKAAVAVIGNQKTADDLIALVAAKQGEWEVALSDQGKVDVTRALEEQAKGAGLTGIEDLRARVEVAKAAGT